MASHVVFPIFPLLLERPPPCPPQEGAGKSHLWRQYAAWWHCQYFWCNTCKERFGGARRKACTGSSKPLSSTRTGSVTQRPPVLELAMRRWASSLSSTSPAAAFCCSRAARLTVSPSAVGDEPSLNW